MLKTTLTASAVAVAFVTAPALSQTSPAPGTQQPAQQQPAQPMPPAQPSTGAGASNTQSTPGQARFFTAMEQDQWRASKFMGVDIYGANNEKIGDVDDVILDRQGKVEAVVIGVGGFLGIGEKQVALPFEQVEWMTDDRATATSSAAPRTGSGAAGTAGTAGTAANAPAPAAPGAAARNPDITASTVRAGARQDYPTYGLVRMTKQELQNAPSYRYGEQLNTGATGGAGAPATGTTRP